MAVVAYAIAKLLAMVGKQKLEDVIQIAERNQPEYLATLLSLKYENCSADRDLNPSRTEAKRTRIRQSSLDSSFMQKIST